MTERAKIIYHCTNCATSAEFPHRVELVETSDNIVCRFDCLCEKIISIPITRVGNLHRLLQGGAVFVPLAA